MMQFKTRETPDAGTQHAQAKISTSILNDDRLLSETIWAISLARKKHTEHAYLIIEGMRNKEYTVFRSDLLLAERKPPSWSQSVDSSRSVSNFLWGLSQNVSGQAFIKLKELSIEELSSLAEMSEYQHWPLAADKAEKVLRRLVAESKKDYTYNVAGNNPSFSASYSHLHYHNCVSWCQTILKEEVGIDTGSAWTLIKRPSTILRQAIEHAKQANDTMGAGPEGGKGEAETSTPKP